MTYKMLLSPPTYFGLDAQLRQIPFKFYMIQLILFFIEAIQCFSFLSNIQIFKSFKVSLIQASYSVWRQPFYKHSNLQIIQSFFNSSQLFSVVSALLQTFISSNHSKFLLLRQHCSVASAFSIHTAISSEIAFLVIGVNAESIHTYVIVLPKKFIG